jgi:hypothetical protein
MMWLVKRYIAKLKGHLVNWALVATSTPRKKARKQKVKGLKNGSTNIFEFNYEELVRRVEGDGVYVTCTMKVEKQTMVGDDAKCSFRALVPKILLVIDVHLCLCELLTLTKVKMSFLKSKKVKLDEKLIGLLLNMDDREFAAIKA